MPSRSCSLAFLASVIACGAVGSCSREPVGELLLVVTTDLSIPKDLDTLHVSITLPGGGTLLDQDYRLDVADPWLPGTIAVVSGPKTTGPVTVRAAGLLAGVERISREVIATVPDDHVVTLPLPLDWLCIGVPCAEGETCQAGACVSATVDAAAASGVPPLASPGAGAASAAEGGAACFDPAACFTSATLWPLPLGAGCSLPKPGGGAGVDVALLVRGGDGVCQGGSCLVVLEGESAEGWRSSADGAQIELPPAVCENAAVAAVEVTTACAGNEDNVVLCAGDPDLGTGCTGDAGKACPEGYACANFGRQSRCVPSNPPVVVGVVDAGSAPDGEDGGECTPEAGPGAVLIDDMTGSAQIKLAIPAGSGTPGFWFTFDGAGEAGEIEPAMGSAFSYAAVTPTAVCAPPVSRAACMRSAVAVVDFAGMGFNFRTAGTNADGGPSQPIPLDVRAYKGIRFWARAAAGGMQNLSVQFPDGSNYASSPGAACLSAQPLTCGNYFQSTVALTDLWQPYEVDFASLSLLLNEADGFYSASAFDDAAAIGVEFSLFPSGPDAGGVPDANAGLGFDVCVASIYFVPQ